MLVTLLVAFVSFSLVFAWLLAQRVWQERTAENLDLLESLLDRRERSSGTTSPGKA
jgi:hypothetical protein